MSSKLILYGRRVGIITLLALTAGLHLGCREVRQYPEESQWYVPAANPERGLVLIREYGCGTCHTIPGVSGATGRVGPRLDQLNEQAYIGGVLSNSPQNLVSWIQNPQEASPRTAMPDLDVSEKDARDIAAYLYTRP